MPLALPRLPVATGRFLRRPSPAITASMAAQCSSFPLILVFCPKSAQENDLCNSLTSKVSNFKIAGVEEEISVLTQSDGDSIMQKAFKSHLYMAALSTKLFGRLLIWSPRLPSTHDLVSQNFCEIPLGSVCLAEVQFKGRGRSMNVWESPPGCIMFSFTLQMEDGRKLPLLQYVVSLAITEATKDVCQAQGLPQLDVRIKWPNDLYLNGLKVGGILCTSTYRSKKFNVCAGVGLNLDNEKPTTCFNKVLQELCPASGQIKKEVLLAAFFNRFENLFKVFLEEGFHVLQELYCQTWLHSGQKVVIEEKHEGHHIENVVVTIQGLTSSGYLLATDEENKAYELHPDGNSLDFFKGLVRKKLE